VQLLNCFRGRTGKRLADRAVDGCAGYDLATRITLTVAALANVDSHSARRHLTRGLAIKDVVSGDAGDGETVARVALSVSPNSLVAQSGICARSVQKVSTDARA